MVSADRISKDGTPLRWVFGYGSLIWNPGFPHHEARPATLLGAHRSLCIYSHRHRGTPERPGLVFGLVRGGSCRGMAFEVAPATSKLMCSHPSPWVVKLLDVRL